MRRRLSTRGTHRSGGGRGRRLLLKLLVAFLAGVVLGLIFLTGGRPQPKAIPSDDQHRPLVEALSSGEIRLLVEKKCLPCHGPQGTPLSSAHPPQERCLLCHPAH